MTSAKRITEEECWFVIGAHQAGASERECSDLSGLSKTITHNIINNFKKQGSPHATKLSVNALLNTSKRKLMAAHVLPQKFITLILILYV